MVDVFVMVTARMVGRGEKVVSRYTGQRSIDGARECVIKTLLKKDSTRKKATRRSDELVKNGTG